MTPYSLYCPQFSGDTADKEVFMKYFRRVIGASISATVIFFASITSFAAETGFNAAPYMSKAYQMGQIGAFQTKDMNGQTVTNE